MIESERKEVNEHIGIGFVHIIVKESHICATSKLLKTRVLTGVRPPDWAVWDSYYYYHYQQIYLKLILQVMLLVHVVEFICFKIVGTT